jgi:cell fate regulator YaaT (PSP1 superfamily)
MRLVGVEYTFDNSKLIFYFTCETRVDFRELVKDLASTFRTRIELRQIGIRDATKLMGGLGVCGRKYCCAGFLTDFVQVTIKMAKEQNFSLNSAKVSGACGRLMCCLRYEHEVYEEAIRVTPPVGTIVHTSDGEGTVIDTKPLAQEIKVKLNDNEKDAGKFYKIADLKVLSRPEKKKGKHQENAADELDMIEQ